MPNLSPLQKARYAYEPKLPVVFKDEIANIAVVLGEPTESIADQIQLRGLFPLTYGAPVARFAKGSNPESAKARKIGVILSGGQAPGGHNVIAGIFDALKKANPDSTLYGFKGGPAGIIDDNLMEITGDIMNSYRNSGGFDIIGSGRTKLETEEQLNKAVRKELKPIVRYELSGEDKALELRFWIDDPKNGLVNVKDVVLLAVWDSFHANDIEIAFPQRDLHIKSVVPLSISKDSPQPVVKDSLEVTGDGEKLPE